jgi:hypothetical protein
MIETDFRCSNPIIIPLPPKPTHNEICWDLYTKCLKDKLVWVETNKHQKCFPILEQCLMRDIIKPPT